MTIRIMLADDHRIIRQGLRALLTHQSHLEVVAEAEDGWQALELGRKLRPDIAVMDVVMPGLNGVDATRQLRQDVPDTQVIMLSGFQQVHYVRESLGAGAAAYVVKRCAPAELVEVIEAVQVGERGLLRGFADHPAPEVLMPQTQSHRAQSAQDPVDDGLLFEEDAQQLTFRERQVLKLYAQGLSTKEVAYKLELSSKTVDTYRAHLYLKLGCRNLVELTHAAIRAGLVAPGG